LRIEQPPKIDAVNELHEEVVEQWRREI
jgi:hypothetical protein